MNVSEIHEFIRKEVKDWDEEAIATARFKAFSGQRSDWQPRYVFWRDLILKISRHFSLLILNPSEVKNDWFNRGGLMPLCFDHVLHTMYSEGEIINIGDLADPTGWRLARLFKKALNLVAKPVTREAVTGDPVVVATLLKGRSIEVMKSLSESHWTSSCIITMKKFHKISGGSLEASAILSYLSGCAKAQYFSIRTPELIEGVKLSLSQAAVSGITSLDYSVLHLIWTADTLHQQLDVIDQRYDKSKESALASLKSGNKKVALRHARQLKLTSGSRQKCLSLINRVEEVLNIIADAESTRKVSEAIQIGARAIKENQISLDEVQLCLQKIDETVDSQIQIDKTLALAETSTLYSDLDDGDIEEEFEKLELELKSDNDQVLTIETSQVTETSGSTELLDGLSNLKISDVAVKKLQAPDSVHRVRNDKLNNHELEAV